MVLQVGEASSRHQEHYRYLCSELNKMVSEAQNPNMVRPSRMHCGKLQTDGSIDLSYWPLARPCQGSLDYRRASCVLGRVFVKNLISGDIVVSFTCIKCDAINFRSAGRSPLLYEAPRDLPERSREVLTSVRWTTRTSSRRANQLIRLLCLRAHSSFTAVACTAAKVQSDEELIGKGRRQINQRWMQPSHHSSS